MIEQFIALCADVVSWRRYRWAHLFGSVGALLAILFSVVVLMYSPQDTAVLMRHGGVFFTPRLVVGVVLGGWLLVYLLALVRQRAIFSTPGSVRVIVFWAAITTVLLLLTPPYLSSDAYGNASRAIIAEQHQINPYVVPPADMGYGDVVAWGEQIAPYGPLFTSYSILLAKVSGSSVNFFVVLFRLGSIVFLGLGAWLLYRIVALMNPDRARTVLGLFLLNPFVLLECVHSAHNDVMVMLAILAAIWFCLQQRFHWALVCLTAGYLVKFSPVALVPLVFVLLWVSLPMKKRILQLFIGAGISALLLMLLYWPYGNAIANISRIIGGFVLINNLTFPQALIYIILENVHRVIPSFTNSLVMMRLGYIALFFIVYAAAIFYPGVAKKETWASRWLWILVAFVFLLGVKVNVWYMLWFLPFLYIAPGRWYRGLIVISILYGVLYYAMLSVFFPSVIVCVLGVGYYLYSRWQSPRSPTTSSSDGMVS